MSGMRGRDLRLWRERFAKAKKKEREGKGWEKVLREYLIV